MRYWLYTDIFWQYFPDPKNWCHMINECLPMPFAIQIILKIAHIFGRKTWNPVFNINPIFWLANIYLECVYRKTKFNEMYDRFSSRIMDKLFMFSIVIIFIKFCHFCSTRLIFRVRYCSCQNIWIFVLMDEIEFSSNTWSLHCHFISMSQAYFHGNIFFAV